MFFLLLSDRFRTSATRLCLLPRVRRTISSLLSGGFAFVTALLLFAVVRALIALRRASTLLRPLLRSTLML